MVRIFIVDQTNHERKEILEWHLFPKFIIYPVSDCYSGQSTRGVPGGRVLGWGSQDQELDGNTKTQGLRQIRAAMCVIPYVLCSGLY